MHFRRSPPPPIPLAHRYAQKTQPSPTLPPLPTFSALSMSPPRSSPLSAAASSDTGYPSTVSTAAYARDDSDSSGTPLSYFIPDREERRMPSPPETAFNPLARVRSDAALTVEGYCVPQENTLYKSESMPAMVSSGYEVLAAPPRLAITRAPNTYSSMPRFSLARVRSIDSVSVSSSYSHDNPSPDSATTSSNVTPRLPVPSSLTDFRPSLTLTPKSSFRSSTHTERPTISPPRPLGRRFVEIIPPPQEKPQRQAGFWSGICGCFS